MNRNVVGLSSKAGKHAVVEVVRGAVYTVTSCKSCAAYKVTWGKRNGVECWRCSCKWGIYHGGCTHAMAVEQYVLREAGQRARLMSEADARETAKRQHRGLELIPGGLGLVIRSA